jgi:hypothetical protein
VVEEFGMKRISVVLLVALFCGAAHAEDGQGRWAKRFWKASIAAVAAGSIVDIQSSLGKHETNGLLANSQGIFSMQGVGLKLALAGAAIGTQQYLLHHHPAASCYKTGALINFAVAGTLGGVAIHNYGTRLAQ